MPVNYLGYGARVPVTDINAILADLATYGTDPNFPGGAANAQNLIKFIQSDQDYQSGQSVDYKKVQQALQYLKAVKPDYPVDVAPQAGSELTYTGPSQVTTGPGGTSSQTAPPPPPPPPTTAAEDQASIESEGMRQYKQWQDYISSDVGQRELARQKLAKLLTEQAAQSFAQTLPQTAEDYNARGLLNSSGYQQEVARQQATMAKAIASQLGLAGLTDVERQSLLGEKALSGLQGFQTSGLQRGFSLSDWEKQAQLAKEIGAMSAPDIGGGKGAVGSTLTGIGAIAPYAGFAATGNPLWLGQKATATSGGGK